MKHKIKIGITNCSKYNNYEKWMLDDDEGIEIIKLSYNDDNARLVNECDGIILSGGEDVHPKFYNKPEYLSLLNKNNIDEKRDEFEFKIIERSLDLQKPVLGICRGLQVMNIFLGGTLIYDIPSVLKVNEHGKINGIDQWHKITVLKESILYKIVNTTYGEINSAHHQTVDTAANDLKIIARSSSITEAMQWKEPDQKSWLLLVQWHPERMPDNRNSFAFNIKQEFVRICRVAV